MSANGLKLIAQVATRDLSGLLADWMADVSKGRRRFAAIDDAGVRGQCRDFVSLFAEAIDKGDANVESAPWASARDVLSNLSRSGTLAGSTPSEVAGLVLAFKRPLFTRLSASVKDAAPLAEAALAATDVIDGLALHTTEVFQKSREDVIYRQQQDMLELSTPVVKLWNGILALPMIGTLDSGRTQIVMEQLLERIVETGAEIAILDITGVPTVDTLVAQHLLKTVTAARLMGADCIISGIRPQIAQTIVHLGVDLQGVITKATMADAFALALKRKGLRVVRATGPALPAASSSSVD